MRPAGLVTCDTADLEVCATFRIRGLDPPETGCYLLEGTFVMSVKHYSELLTIFALEEQVQAKYFPRFANPVHVPSFEESTTSARYIALRALETEIAWGRVHGGEFAELCTEILSVSYVMIQLGCTYDWLLAHPDDVGPDPLEPRIYGLWAVLRRLCREACSQVARPNEPRPFMELFAADIEKQ